MFTDTSAAFSQTTGLTVQALCELRERERETDGEKCSEKKNKDIQKK